MAKRKKKQLGSSSSAAAAASQSNPGNFPIIAIGASAGGLEAFKQLFSAMPPDSGMAFVLIPHLDPSHESLMVKILSGHTRMPVAEAANGMKIAANHVYIIPPGKFLAISGGSLLLSKPPPLRRHETAIDFALRSLADDRHEDAIGIVLSGTGSHGTLGIKEIKAVGGMAMVQDPATAAYGQMPGSAIATGLVDYVLAPEKMPDALLEYARAPGIRANTESGPAAVEDDEIMAVIEAIRESTQYDFRYYRKNMIARRVKRRMNLLKVADIADYAKYLRKQPAEIAALYKDLLISVTTFFRQPEAFCQLAKHVLPQLVERSAPDTPPVRVWVPGCATGEEAYSIGMLLLEQFREANKTPNVQIFATDLDRDALDVARYGSYAKSIEAALSPDLLQRYFTRPDDGHYRVTQQLRELIVFAPHNLIGDTPFSRQDLISCRNLLIYLDSEIQEQAIALFHLALNDGGHLLLGPAETAQRDHGMFEPISRKWRLYRKVGQSRRDRVNIPLVASDQGHWGVPHDRAANSRAAGPIEAIHRHLIDEFVPASALISRDYQLLSVHGPLVNYLGFPSGPPTKDITALARRGLRAKIRTSCQQAIHENRVIHERNARVNREGSYVPCSITVQPVSAPKAVAGLLLIVFQDRNSVADDAPSAREGDDSVLVRQLEGELWSTREELQNTIDELANSNQELRIANEEAMSSNEELQSSNEELETSKEELQSLNEELATVNSQLQEKVDELDRSNDDLANLMAATHIAAVFLDADLSIKKFTPPTRDLFRLIDTDVGRAFRDFAPRFVDDSLLGDCQRVLESAAPMEKEVCTDAKRWYLRRVLPYITERDRIEGLAVTFTDITKRHQDEQEIRNLNAELEQRVVDRTVALRHSEERIRAVVDAAMDAIITIDDEGAIETFNAAAERMFGYSAAEAIGRNVEMLMPSPDRERHGSYLNRYRQTGERRVIGAVRKLTAKRRDGSTFPIELSVSEVKHLNVFTGIVRDISDEQQLQREILRIAVDEQHRIAQDLHDGTQQELFGLQLLAQSLQDAVQGGDETLVSLTTALAEGIPAINEQLRAVTKGLMPVQVDVKGLMSALAEFATVAAERSGLTCTFDCPKRVGVHSDVVATNLYRIAQDAVTNAVKHAQNATSISIALRATEKAIVLTITDDGAGIVSTAQAAKSNRLGRRIMGYRSNMIGGTLTFDTAPGGGTVVECVVPTPNLLED
jgi:two-component system CheB/CheR fusion protein